MRLYQRTGAAKVVRRSGLLKLMKLDETERCCRTMDSAFLIPGKEQLAAGASAAAGAPLQWLHDGDRVRGDESRGRAGDGAQRVRGDRAGRAAVLRRAGRAQRDDGRGAGSGARRISRRSKRAATTPIVVTAAGCGAALKEYGFLLKDDPVYAERATRFSARVRDVTEYLAGQRDHSRRRTQSSGR